MKPSLNHKNRQLFNRIAYDISDSFLYRFTALYKGHLYDLGCGEMPYREWLLNYTESYTGVDWGNSLHQLTADILADLNEPLPINSEVADTIISLSVIEHLQKPEQFLNEAYRILKPGGNIILQVPFMWWVHEAPYDFFRYTRYGLQYLFEKSGFQSIQVFPQTGFWVMWTLKFNYQTNRLIRGPWIIKKVIELGLRIIWAINQPMAVYLDKYWKCESETAGYYVVAKRA